MRVKRLKRFRLLLSLLLLIFVMTVSCSNNTVLNKSPNSDVNIIDGFWESTDNISTEGVLYVPESYIDFGTVYIHANPKLHSTRRIHVNNIGGGVLDYQTSTLINDFYFDTELTTCGLTGGRLEPLASCVYVINFMPVSVSEPTGTIRITSKNEATAVKIHGKGDLILRGNVNADYDQITYPVTMIDSTVSVLVTVKNTGSEPVRFKTTLPDNPFSISGGNCALLNQRLGSNATCTMIISFNPKITGEFKSRVILTALDGIATMPHYINLNGLAIRDGVITVPENEINFGLVTVGDSKMKQFSITNAGTLAINFKTIMPDGFSDGGSTCNLQTFQRLNGGESCLVRLLFRPTRAIQYTDIIRFATNKGTNADIKLIGAGMDREPISMTPTLVNFGTILINTVSPERSVLITNTARLPIRFDITMPDNFLYQPSSSCALKGAYLEPDKSCIINIAFNPKERKTYADNVILTHRENTEGTVSFSVEGNGTVLGDIETTPTEIDFGNVEINTLAPIKVLTLTNIGGLPLTVSTAFPTGFTATTGSCTLFNQALNAGESCTFEIRFNPTALTSYDGNIVMSYGGKQKLVPIKGSGATPPSITFDTNPITFDDTPVGFTSPTKILTINSVGGVDALVNIILPAGFESAGGTCTLPLSTVAPGRSCNLNMVFKPTVARLYTGNLVITHAGVTTTITLNGTGYNAPEISATPTLTTFNDTVVGLISPMRTITLQNIGDRDATFTTTLPPFVRYNATSTCVLNNQILLPSATCLLNIEFTPTAPNNYTGNISYNVVSGKNTSSQVQGRGLADATITATPTALSFGNVVINTASKREITLENTGGVDTSINLTFTTAYTLDATSTCAPLGQILRVGESCKVVVSFEPTAMQTYNGSLTVRYNIFSPVGTRDLTLNLTGVGTAKGELSLSTAVINFPQTAVGMESPVQKVTAFNIGGGPIDVSVTMPANFVLRTDQSTCASPVATIPIGGNCEYAFTFKPQVVDNITGTITFTYGLDTRTLAVSGRSVAGSIANFNPAMLEFNNKTINVKSTSMQVILSNIGDQVLRYTITPPTAPFTLETTSTCNLTGSLAVSSTCVIDLAFTPTALTAYAGELTVLDTTKGIRTTLPITGTGIEPQLTITPSSIVFEDTKVNANSSTAQIIVRNSATTTVRFWRTTLTGFQIVAPPAGGSIPACGNNGDTLAVGTSCIYNLQFRPLATQVYQGVMSFFLDDGNSYELRLAGRGTPATFSLAFSSSEVDFHETAINYEKQKSVVIENITDKEVAFDILMPIDFNIDNSSECNEKNKLKAYESCELLMNFKPDDSYDYATSVQVTEKDVTEEIKIKAKSVTQGSVIYLYDKVDGGNIKFTADDDNILLLNLDSGELTRYNKSAKLYESLAVFDIKLSNPEMVLDNATSLHIKDNATKTLIQYNLESRSFEYKDFSTIRGVKSASSTVEKKLNFNGYRVLQGSNGNAYLIDNRSEMSDEKSIELYDIKTDKRSAIAVKDSKKRLSFKTAEPLYIDGNIYLLDQKSGAISVILP